MSDKAYVHKLPTCDIHGDHDAQYDLKIPGDGRWGNVCEALYVQFGSPALGTGRGQELIVGEEPVKSDRLRRAEIAAALDAGDLDMAEDLIGDGDICEWL